MRLLSRGRNDYTKRFPRIVEAALKRRHKQFIIDGEAVLLEFHGISDFDGPRSGKQDEAVQRYAFDILALDGEDLRALPLGFAQAQPRATACPPP